MPQSEEHYFFCSSCKRHRGRQFQKHGRKTCRICLEKRCKRAKFYRKAPSESYSVEASYGVCKSCKSLKRLADEFPLNRRTCNRCIVRKRRQQTLNRVDVTRSLPAVKVVHTYDIPNFVFDSCNVDTENSIAMLEEMHIYTAHEYRPDSSIR